MTSETSPGEPPDPAEVMRAMLARDAFSRWLGVELMTVRAGHCTLRMRVREEMLNGFGVSHGGIVFSLADSAMAFACNHGDFVTVAVENQVSYPLAVHANDELVAVVDEETATGRLGFYHATVRNQDGAVVALFRGTVYRTRRPHLIDSTS